MLPKTLIDKMTTLNTYFEHIMGRRHFKEDMIVVLLNIEADIILTKPFVLNTRGSVVKLLVILLHILTEV